MQTMTAAEYRQGAFRAGRRKYGNKPIVIDGVRFASGAEARGDGVLLMRLRLGEVRNIKRQPRFPLVVNERLICTYVGDWLYEEKQSDAWHFVCEDKKGAITKDFKIKFALAKALHPEIEWRLS